MKRIVFVFSMLICENIFGQAVIKVTEPLIDSTPYRSYFSHYIHNHFYIELSNFGMEGTAYITFNITKGRLENVACDTLTPKPIADFFERMLASTNGKWVINDSKNSVYILPIYYVFQLNGKYKKTASIRFDDFLKTIFGNFEILNKKDYFELIVLYPVEYLSPYIHKMRPRKRLNN